MKRYLSILLSLALLCALIPVGSAAPASEFIDVPEHAWYHKEVYEAAQLGLLNGVDENSFAPEGLTTRAMLLTALHRLAGTPAAKGGAGFSDVAAEAWYANAVAWAAEQEIALGFEDNTFRPDRPVTREQTAVFLSRFAAACGYETALRTDLARFADASDISEWARQGLSWAVAANLLSGSKQHGAQWLTPSSGTTRAQLAAMLCRFYHAFTEDCFTVGYLPLDNRPVNDYRPLLQAQSAGIRILMPEESLYATRLDGQTPNPNGTRYGDREGLLEWLRQNESRCDAFVISLDQLLSGGLVSSRALCDTDFSLELAALDYLAELSARKPVYAFDTVMRLASTVDYMGMGSKEANLLRSYGAVTRQALTGEDLTVERIVAGYRYNEKGEEIPTKLPQSQLSAYLQARERKLRLADKTLTAAEDFAFYLVGVDDSVQQRSIQSNEIDYITARFGENGALLCGTDELGMMMIARAYCDRFPRKMSLRVRYFGNGADAAADEYDTGTLRQCVDQHILLLNCTQAEQADADVLLLTRGYTARDYTAWLQALQENDAAGRFSIALDASRSGGDYSETMEGLPLRYLLGYSCWGTAANTVGLGLSMGITRWARLVNGAPSDRENAAFAESLTFALVKDLAYCRHLRNSIRDLTPEGIETYIMSAGKTQRLLAHLSSAQLAADLCGETFYTVPQMTLKDFGAPLARRYEIRFRVEPLE